MSTADEIKALRQALDEFRADMATSRRERINARPRDPEKLDPTPMAVPVEYQGPPSTRELVQEYVRQEMSAYAKEQDMGTFEEEDDFEPDGEDEVLSLSGFEVTEFPFEPEEAPEEAPQEIVASEAAEAASEPSANPPVDSQP